MLHYEPKVRLKPSSITTIYDRLIAYRNVAGMLASFAETLEEKQAIKDLPIEPCLYESALYTRLIERMRTFFAGAFEDPFDYTHDERVTAFYFCTFHNVDEEEGLYDSEYPTRLHQLLAGGLSDPEWIVRTAIDWGLPLPDTIPSDVHSADYIHEQLAALPLAPNIKKGLLCLFYSCNFIWDNPFVCLYDESPWFEFEWGRSDFSVDEFQQLKRTWTEAQPIINSCLDLLEIFRKDTEQAQVILRAVWRSLLIPTRFISKQQRLLPFDPPVWSEPEDVPSDPFISPAGS